MLSVRLYGTRTKERGKVECSEVEVGCGCCYLSDIESIEGAVDIIDILHHHNYGVSFAINIHDVVSIKTA